MRAALQLEAITFQCQTESNADHGLGTVKSNRHALKHTCLQQNVHITLDVHTACLQSVLGSSLRGQKIPTMQSLRWGLGGGGRDGGDQYLRLGRTCWTAVLMDCVHWPPGPSHTGPESKRFLRASRLVSSRRLRQHAAHARRQTCTFIRQ